MRLFIVGSAAALFAGSAFGTVLNGSFESAALPAPDRVDISNLTDWGVTGGSTVLLERGVNGVSQIAAHGGVQFVTMGHNSGQGETLTQLLSTTPGQAYTATFYLACIQGDALQSVRMAVSDGANDLGSVVGTVSSRTEGWVPFSFDFVANGLTARLTLTQTVGASEANVAIDDVSVVPAPGSALALLGLVAARRGRR
ncbi:MAG: DUF642 domain-containing protein [Phycisphaerales bacterium]|nr:DUF642 domain-containing protein [Phycisphaerales bacterium]